MRVLFDYLRRYRHKRHVRPWALSVPILVFCISLPMLRPLRHPDPRAVSDEETARLATVQAVVEHGTLAIDNTDFTTTRKKLDRPARDGTGDVHWYADQPPMMAVLLSGSYWVMARGFGLTFARDPLAVAYVLTLLGVTIPVACAAGLVYRMGRLFELRRPWRTLLAAAAVLATGLISYATVLNAHAPAAALVLASAACFIHVTVTASRPAAIGYLLLAGFTAALAATLDPSAVPFLLLFLVVIAALRWRVSYRAVGVVAYAAGAALPILVHARLTVPVTGDVWQGVGTQRSEVSSQRSAVAAGPSDLTSDVRPLASLDEGPPTLWERSGEVLSRVAAGFVGDHGILVHFPVLLMGVLGVTMVLRRHWPSPPKALAWATLASAAALVVAYALNRTAAAGWRDAMFGARWFVVFAPLVLFWSGAWLRRGHRPMSWAAAAVLLLFSTAVSLVGATGPAPRDGFTRDGADRYTAAEALSRLIDRPAPADVPPVLAGR